MQLTIRTQLKLFGAILLSLFYIDCAQAIEPIPKIFGNMPKEEFQVFPISSEFQIGKILPIVQRAPQGVYLTVGSERGFRAASMTPGITYLILLDLSKDIVRYNLINSALLKADSRKDYLDLRWHADLPAWNKFKEETQKKYQVDVALNKDDFEWWQRNVRDIKAMPYQLPEHLNRYHKSPVCTDKKVSKEERQIDLGQIVDYKSGNYLFYDDLYNNLHQLAIHNKIFSAQINLLDKEQVNTLTAYLADQHLNIGVLDLDNLYYQDYLGQKPYLELVQKLLPFGSNDSLLIAMSNYKNYACGQFQNYIGFTFENIKQWPNDFKMQDFFDSLPKQVNELINGRLYEGNEPLPVFKRKSPSS